jgi:hypothetical protein
MSDVIEEAVGVRIVGVMSGQRYPVPGACTQFRSVEEAQDWCDEANRRLTRRLTRWEPVGGYGEL